MQQNVVIDADVDVDNCSDNKNNIANQYNKHLRYRYVPLFSERY